MTVWAETFQWLGFGLSFLAAFALSLLHNALSGASKIWLSRTLDDRDKARRTKLLDTYEETRLSVEVIRLDLYLYLEHIHHSHGDYADVHWMIVEAKRRKIKGNSAFDAADQTDTVPFKVKCFD